MQYNPENFFKSNRVESLLYRWPLARLNRVVLDYRGIARTGGGVSYFSDTEGGRLVFV